MKPVVPRLMLTALTVGLPLLLVVNCRGGKEEPGSATVEQRKGTGADYVGRVQCKECHQQEYDLFTGSDHDMAMDTATEATVLGDFNNVFFTHFGVTSRFYRDGDRFMVHTEGPDGTLEDYQISYVFGIRPLQQYLIAFPGGRLQCLPTCWDTRPAGAGGQKWFHIYQDERIPPGDLLYWTRITQNWNYMCAECHSTDLHKNYSYKEKAYHTTWSEIDVSCEACHGPGSEHIEWARQMESGSLSGVDPSMGLVVRLKDTDNASWVFHPDSVTARRSIPRSSDVMVQMCARCHSRRAVATEAYYHGGSLLNTHWPSLLEEGLYFADGQIEDEVYVYGSFLQSKMYQAGVICKDCHEPHSGKVYSDGNALCYRCHMATEFGTRKHHFHDPAKAGASCTDCHMPERTYMVVDPRRDHSIRIPRPDLSEKLGTPNACNQCHADKSISWATQYVKKWYGEDFVNREHYGETFWAGRRQYPEALDDLISLAGDRDRPPMVRATAIYLLQNYPTPEATALLRLIITDAEPLIRYATLQAAERGEAGFIRDLAVPRLRDSVLVVRLTAARLLTRVPREMIPAGSMEGLNKALEEYGASLMINADHPSTHMNFGNMYLNTGNYEKAEASYKEAIDLEPGLVGPYINLADLYRRENRDDLGEKVLEEALERYPELPAVNFALGLLKVRKNQSGAAMEYLRRAADLAPEDAHYSYVYAIALNSQQQPGEAMKVLKEALERHPYDRDILYSLATISMENHQNEQALIYAEKLVAYFPRDPNYQQLIEILQN